MLGMSLFGSGGAASQRDRPISFVMDDPTGEFTASLELVLRPEDLTRQEPSQMSVTQTFGGAWADCWGPAVGTITLAGHTGWRPQADGMDGETRFTALRDIVFANWHKARAAAVQQGSDPSKVHLTYADSLDNITALVAPQAFVLRRSRSRPLLLQYQITLAVLTDDADEFGGDDGGFLGGILDQISAGIKTVRGYISSVQGWVNRNIVTPVRGFLSATSRLYGQVVGLAQQGRGLVTSITGLAIQTARAGANMFRAISQVAALPGFAATQLNQVANTYTNLFCLLRRGFGGGGSFADYGDMFGASNCSSTAGGRPPSPYTAAGTNPLAAVVPPSGPLPVSVTPTAAASITTLAQADVVQQPPTADQIATHVTAVADGLSVSDLALATGASGG